MKHLSSKSWVVHFYLSHIFDTYWYTHSYHGFISYLLCSSLTDRLWLQIQIQMQMKIEFELSYEHIFHLYIETIQIMKLIASIHKSTTKLENEQEKCSPFICPTHQDMLKYVNWFVNISWNHNRNSIYTFISNTLVIYFLRKILDPGAKPRHTC